MSRSVFTQIAGIDFELIYTVAVRKQIGERYGSMQKFVDKIVNAAETGDDIGIIEDLIFVFVRMANQSILRDNCFNGGTRKPWQDEEIEIIFSPYDMIVARDAIFDAINKGNGREVVGEEDGESPNADAGQ